MEMKQTMGERTFLLLAAMMLACMLALGASGTAFADEGEIAAEPVSEAVEAPEAEVAEEPEEVPAEEPVEPAAEGAVEPAEPVETPEEPEALEEPLPIAEEADPVEPEPADTDTAAEPPAETAPAVAVQEAKPSSTASAATPSTAIAAKTAKAATPATKTAKAATPAKKTAATVKAGWYSVKTALGKLYVQAKGNKSATGTKLVLKAANASTGQAIRLVKSGSYFRLYLGVGFKAHMLMDSAGKVTLGTSKGASSLFRAVLADDGSIRFVNKATGRALAVKGGAAKSGALVVGAASTGGAAQSFTLAKRTGILKTGIYSVRTGLSGKRALGPKGGSLAKGKKVALGAYAANLYQKWQVKAVSGKANTYTFENISTGYRLTAASGAAATVKKAAASDKAQWWRPVGANGQVFLKNVATGKMITLDGDSPKAGSAAMCLKASTKDSARWTLKKVAAVSTGFYELDSAANRALALQVAGDSSANGANAQVGTATGADSQIWYYDSSAKTLTLVTTGKNLDVSASSLASGTNVQQWEPNGATAQQWSIAYAGGGNFKVSSKLGSSLVLTAAGTAADANVSSNTNTGAKAQKWHLVQTMPVLTATVAIQFTLDQMARMQKSGNPYYASTTLTYLKSVLNPDNGSKYKFADLRKVSNVSAAKLDAFIATYGSTGKMAKQGAAFVSACKTYGLNAVYLLAHAILESDWGRSELASGYYYKGGTIDGVKYKKGTYYNFFGIGAYDDSPLSGGRKAAIINGWNSPAKAITGAAKWIATNYVYRSQYAQPTLYAMKWDYAYTVATGERGWHQYATSLTWADSIGRLMEQCYAAAGVKPTLSYIMPAYK